MSKFCLDFNIVIRACYPRTEESRFIQQAVKQGDLLFLPAVVMAEVLVKPSREELQKLEALFQLCEVVPVTVEIARHAAQLRAGAENKTKLVFLMDCLIAATALSCQAKLVTHNIKDFSEFTDSGVLIHRIKAT